MPASFAGRDFLALEVSSISENFDFSGFKRAASLSGHHLQVAFVDANVGHLV